MLNNSNDQNQTNFNNTQGVNAQAVYENVESEIIKPHSSAVITGRTNESHEIYSTVSYDDSFRRPRPPQINHSNNQNFATGNAQLNKSNINIEYVKTILGLINILLIVRISTILMTSVVF